MKSKRIKYEWDITPLHNITYDAIFNTAEITWLDSIKNIWLKASAKNILLFKVSNEPQEWELDLLIYLSIEYIDFKKANIVLEELGYNPAFENNIKKRESTSELIQIYLESEISLEVICGSINILEIDNPLCG